MTKKNFIDLIIHKLNGGDSTPDTKGKYHPEIIAKYVELAFSSIINGIQEQAIKYRDFGQLDSYTVTYSPVTVTYDSTREEYYSDLPAKIMNLYKNRGMRFITPTNDQSYHFIYRENNTSNVYNELEVGLLDNKPRWYIEGDKVYYDKQNMIDEIKNNGVMMKFIVPLDEIEEDVNMPIPAGREDYVIDFILKYLQQMLPEDVNNDNNSKQV